MTEQNEIKVSDRVFERNEVEYDLKIKNRLPS